MATRKTANTKTSEEQTSETTTTQEEQGSQDQASQEEQGSQDPGPEKEEAPAEPTTKMVKVYNPQKYFYIQPSTQIKVKAGEVTEIRDDNWAKLQIGEGILQKAK